MAFDHLYLKDTSKKPPVVDGSRYLINGELREWKGEFVTVKSPLYYQGQKEPIVIGQYPKHTEKESLEAIESASKAWNNGRGVWALAPPKERIQKVEEFAKMLSAKVEQIAEILCWEICKPYPDAKKEIERTVKYIYDTIKAAKDLENRESTFQFDEGVMAQIRRAPYGITLCSGPFNYPFNETYTTFIPAVLMGNCVVLKLPRNGVLCHFPTFEMFVKCFPPGVISVVSGSGRQTMPPIMNSGKVDILAFIGTSKAASALQKSHPNPHRLRTVLGLDAKNPACVMPTADLDVALSEILLGSLSFNGQRCTALKICFVHESIADKFLQKLVPAVEALKMGTPFDADVKITPLGEEEKPTYLTEVINDAKSKGAKVMNKTGGIHDRSFFSPTVLFPVNNSMRVFHEEQFGPIIPVATFKDVSEIYDYFANSKYGQQASLFSTDPKEVGKVIDVLANQVSRINLNCQCQRGPDSFPFCGRKDSAYGTLSVGDALRVFSIRSLVATKETQTNKNLVAGILQSQSSNFLRMDYLF